MIPAEDMVRKIRVARGARESAEFLIITRIDARTAHGLDEALRRADAYAKAGADILFVESPESEEEIARICASFDAPCLANMVEGGRTPVLTREHLIQIGYQAAIFPAAGFLAAASALTRVYSAQQARGSTAQAGLDLFAFSEMNKLMGFEQVWEFERRNAEEGLGSGPTPMPRSA